jgi:hypothetical protein
MASGTIPFSSRAAMLHRQRREARAKRRARVHATTNGKNDDEACPSLAPTDDEHIRVYFSLVSSSISFNFM